MTKYVLDLPEGVKFIVVKGYMMLSEKELLRIPVENLQEYNAPTVAEDAPVEKRVIELPDDVIGGVQNAKYYWKNVAGFVLNVPSIVFPEIRKSIGEPHASYDKVADILGSWYFGNIEFVAKKEPKFEVVVKIGTVTKKTLLSDANYVVFYSDPEHAPSGYQYLFSDEQADELVAGLTALNARKVKVEE